MIAEMTKIEQMLAQARMAEGQPMSNERLKEVFDLVKPVGNWKGPISAYFTEEQATPAEVRTAVAWFAGGEPEIEVLTLGTYRVTGAGYYEWVGA